MEIKNYFAQDAQGNIMPSANCYLYLPGTTTLATGLVDGNGSPISNPFIASGMGQIKFGAPNGVYDLRVALGARDWTIKVQCADIVQAMDVMDSILGSHAENPTTRNNGQPLEAGDETWNSTDKQPYWWSGTAWVALNSSTQQLEERLADDVDASNGASILARGVVVVKSMRDLLSAAKRADQLVDVVAYHDGWAVENPYVGPRGGGAFRWSASVPKALHNGGTIIDPDRTYPVTWSTMAQRTAWFNPATSGSGVWCRVFSGASEVTWFGARGYGESDALSFQRCISAVNDAGGGRVFIPNPPVEWMLDSPVYLFNRTETFGSGPGCKIVFLNPLFSHGRGGFVMGSSVEANRAKAMANYAAGTFPAASTIDNSYVNLPLGTYLRDSPANVESRDCSIHDIYPIARWTLPTGWGGYAINFVNAWNCHAWNIYGEGWTQIIGMGSDVAPETPTNHACTAYQIHCMTPDPLRTYYSIGFISNSTESHLSIGRQHMPCTELGDGAKEGNMAAMNSCEDCTITDMKTPNLGKISYASSTGVYMADCRGCFIDDIDIGNAKRAAQSFFFRAESISATKPNVFGKNIIGRNCDTVISMGAKFTHVLGFKNIGCTYDIEFYNSNVTGCVVSQKPEKINFGAIAGWLPYQYLDNNDVIGWRPKDIYLRPLPMLMNDKTDTASWNTNKSVATKAGVALSFQYEIPPSVTAIRGFSLYTTYAGNSQADGMNITASIRTMTTFNGNSGEAPVVKQTIVAPGAHAVTTDRILTSSTDLLVVGDSSGGLSNSADFVIQVTSPTLNSVIKETRLRCYM